VPWALEMTSVPLGALLPAGVPDADGDDDDVGEDDDDGDDDEHAATVAAASIVAAPVRIRRLIPVVLH